MYLRWKKKDIDPITILNIHRVYIAKAFPGWRLDYIDSFTLEELKELQGTMEGIARYEKAMQKTKS